MAVRAATSIATAVSTAANREIADLTIEIEVCGGVALIITVVPALDSGEIKISLRWESLHWTTCCSSFRDHITGRKLGACLRIALGEGARRIVLTQRLPSQLKALA